MDSGATLLVAVVAADALAVATDAFAIAVVVALETFAAVVVPLATTAELLAARLELADAGGA